MTEYTRRTIALLAASAISGAVLVMVQAPPSAHASDLGGCAIGLGGALGGFAGIMGGIATAPEVIGLGAIAGGAAGMGAGIQKGNANCPQLQAPGDPGAGFRAEQDWHDQNVTPGSM